ncbi:uncharacterized protein [Haliotis cracherodii]|uniref:uncharacterized protein n=1 Tax=Haliotis cracherodii TaxID=6455 RepID=UPI0039EC6750
MTRLSAADRSIALGSSSGDTSCNCRQWASEGKCETDPATVASCPATCAIRTRTCTDTKSACPNWASYFECYRSSSVNCDCALSCNTPSECDPSSGDTSCNCRQWASEGKCETNPATVASCPATCAIRTSAVRCPDPPTVTNAEPNVAGEYKIYQTITFICVPGATLTSTSSYDKGMKHCATDGTWKNNFYYKTNPVCVQATPAPTTTTTTTTTTTPAPTTLLGTCTDTKSACPNWASYFECYRSSSVNCDCALSCNTPSECDPSSGDTSCNCRQWASEGKCETNPATVASCPATCAIRTSAVRCPDPPTVTNAEPNVAGEYKIYQTITFICVPGATLTSTSSYDKGMKHCATDGTWKNNFYYKTNPVCVQDDPTTTATTTTTTTSTTTTTTTTTTIAPATIAPVFLASVNFIETCTRVDKSFIKPNIAPSVTVIQTITKDTVQECAAVCVMMTECAYVSYDIHTSDCTVLRSGGVVYSGGGELWKVA